MVILFIDNALELQGWVFGEGFDSWSSIRITLG
jgi:hypothetical protein